MKPVVLAQPHHSVTRRQSKFRVLCVGLLIPMETSALKHTLNVLSRVQKEKGKDKNSGSIKHWSLWFTNRVLHSWFMHWEIATATSLQDLFWDNEEWEAKGSGARRQHLLWGRTFPPGPEEHHHHHHPPSSLTCLPLGHACLERSLRPPAFFSSMNYLHGCEVFHILENLYNFSFQGVLQQRPSY